MNLPKPQIGLDAWNTTLRVCKYWNSACYSSRNLQSLFPKLPDADGIEVPRPSFFSSFTFLVPSLSPFSHKAPNCSRLWCENFARERKGGKNFRFPFCGAKCAPRHNVGTRANFDRNLAIDKLFDHRKSNNKTQLLHMSFKGQYNHCPSVLPK